MVNHIERAFRQERTGGFDLHGFLNKWLRLRPGEEIPGTFGMFYNGYEIVESLSKLCSFLKFCV